MRGRSKIGADLNLLAGAVNLARLATFGLIRHDHAWITADA